MKEVFFIPILVRYKYNKGKVELYKRFNTMAMFSAWLGSNMYDIKIIEIKDTNGRM
jgi:hypothetical protein